MKTFIVTESDAGEIEHKLGILAEEEDLQDEYKISREQAGQIAELVPRKGGEFTIPDWAIEAVCGEMLNHVEVLRDIASDAWGAEVGQALSIGRQAARFEKMFAIEA